MAAEAQVERTYGNWRRPRPPGLWHLGLISSVLLIVGLIASIIVIALVGLIPGLVLLALMLPVFLVTLRPDPHGQTPMQRARDAARVASRSRERARTCTARGRSAARRTAPSSCPGCWPPASCPRRAIRMTGRSRCSATRGRQHLTVVLETEPDGAALVDQPQVDQWVAHYGQWLAALSQEPGLVACQVSVETAPDPGTRLRHAIQGRQDPNAPALARETLSEIVRLYPAGAADLKARVALTFSMVAAGRRRSATEMAHDLATRLGGITQRLHATGAGVAMPVDAQRLCEIVHAAYNPRAAELLEEARAAGEPAELSWEDVGPAAADARADSYWHDGAVSRDVGDDAGAARRGARERARQADRPARRHRPQAGHAAVPGDRSG